MLQELSSITSSAENLVQVQASAPHITTFSACSCVEYRCRLSGKPFAIFWSIVIIGSRPDLKSGVPKDIGRSSRSYSVKIKCKSLEHLVDKV